MKKLKYYLQRNDWDCGIIVLLNTIKWSGIEVNYKRDYPVIEDILDMHPKELEGTCTHCFNVFMEGTKTINNIPFKYIKKQKNLKIKDIVSNLGNNKAIIFGNSDNRSAHISLIIKASKHFLYVVNLGGKKAIRKISKKRFNKYYLKQWTIGYFIEKQNG